MKIGENIKLLRTKKGITQIELAEKTGIPIASIKFAETNRRGLSRKSLEKLAKFFEVDTTFLQSNLNLVPEEPRSPWARYND